MTLGFWVYYICQNFGSLFSYFCELEARVLGFLRFHLCKSEPWGTPTCGTLIPRTMGLVLAPGTNSSPRIGYPGWQSWSFSLRVPSPFDYYYYYGFSFSLKNFLWSPFESRESLPRFCGNESFPDRLGLNWVFVPVLFYFV